MRQLPGKAAKETRKMKRERKQQNKEGHNRVVTVAIPVCLAVFVMLIVYVYSATSKH
ncbi:predicted protein [Nematostella vectensis]|nr:RecName: Full=Single-pass membrane and coiled-coil domain-containing protein 4 homolog [Nematostella vectensis]EDO43547.1 predicted protein [Nematostella vectensis]|eukprot:XP_001635610.1 predicted protein [Nematostella vectensis]